MSDTNSDIDVLAEIEANDKAIEEAGGWLAYHRKQGMSEEAINLLRVVCQEVDGAIPNFLKETNDD